MPDAFAPDRISPEAFYLSFDSIGAILARTSAAAAVVRLQSMDGEVVQVRRGQSGPTMTAEGGGGRELTVNRLEVGLWESFELNLSRPRQRPQVGDVIALQTTNGRFVGLPQPASAGAELTARIVPDAGRPPRGCCGGAESRRPAAARAASGLGKHRAFHVAWRPDRLHTGGHADRSEPLDVHTKPRPADGISVPLGRWRPAGYPAIRVSAYARRRPTERGGGYLQRRSVTGRHGGYLMGDRGADAFRLRGRRWLQCRLLARRQYRRGDYAFLGGSFP